MNIAPSRPGRLRYSFVINRWWGHVFAIILLPLARASQTKFAPSVVEKWKSKTDWSMNSEDRKNTEDCLCFCQPTMSNSMKPWRYVACLQIFLDGLTDDRMIFSVYTN